jgi:regulator of sigma E protease
MIMEFISPLLFFVLAICFVVGFHEFGHYLAARLSGVRVDTFSIGMGPRVLSWTSKRTNIEYQLSALPIGGYVKMWETSWLKSNLDRELTDQEKSVCFDKASIAKRFFIVFNGPFFNFLLAVIGYAVINYSVAITPKPIVGNIIPGSVISASDIRTGDQFVSINSRNTEDWESVALSLSISTGGRETIPVSVMRQSNIVDFDLSVGDAEVSRDTHVFEAFGFYPIHASGSNQVIDVTQDSVADNIGIIINDKILLINNCETPNLRSIIHCLQAIKGDELTVSILRKSQTIELSGKWIDTNSLGISTDSLSRPDHFSKNADRSILKSVTSGFSKAIDVTVFTTESLYKLATGNLSPELVGGPVTLAKAADESASHGFLQFFNFLCIFSISLMILNLLPIPPLDGGHLFLNMIDVGFGQKASEMAGAVLVKLGIVFIGLLMIFAIGNDIFYEILR